MNIEIGFLREMISLVGSGIALASTAYFWLVRSNRERPQVSVHPVTPLTGTVLVNEDFETTRAVSTGESEVVAKYWTDLAIVNDSTLPNAVLGVRVWLHFCEGGWREVTIRPVGEDTQPLPLNLPPLTTIPFKLALGVAIPGQLTGGFKEREQAAGDALREEAPIRMELCTLGGKSFTGQWDDGGKGLRRTPAGELQLKAA